MQTKALSDIANVLQFCIDHKALKAGNIIHAYLYRTKQFSDPFPLNRLIELYSKCGRTHSARHLFDQMPVKNIFSYNAVIDTYCKLNDVDNAYQVFSQVPKKNYVSWNMIISAFSNNGFKERALETYSLMRSDNILPTRFTLASVLSACGGLGDLTCGKNCHGSALKIGLDGNVYVGNALLGMYMKCQSTKDAVMVFEDLPEHNEVSFTSMMEGLVKAERFDEAFHMFRLMHKERIVDCVSVSSVLGVCSKSISDDYAGTRKCMNGDQIHAVIIKLGFNMNLHVNNTLLDMYSKHGLMDSAEILFNCMPEISVVSWNVMLSGYGRQVNMAKAMDCIERMQRCGFEPDDVTYVNMLAACLKSGDVETGLEIFGSMSSPSLASWNTILSGCSQNEYHREVVQIFREMQFRKVRSDRTTFAIILSSCATMSFLDSGKQIHGALLKTDFYTDLFVASGLVGVYSKCGKIVTAMHIFNGLPKPDVVCWNSLLTGLSLNSLENEAFDYFHEMMNMGISPTEFTYATVLNCCSSLTSLSQGIQIHGLVMKTGYTNDVFVGSALINMYSKCGNVDFARRVFDIMACKSTVTWNQMIHGYAQNGRGEEAIDFFEKMIQSKVNPDKITFLAVLTACSHSGLVDTGLEILTSMKENYGVEPIIDHYTCIIDSLGRADRFNKVEEVIEKMACRDNPMVWEVLLSSCRVHGNVELARRAADELFRLDPSNSTPYALMANMYSSLDRWSDVKDVRSLMGDLQVAKEPGYSRI